LAVDTGVVVVTAVILTNNGGSLATSVFCGLFVVGLVVVLAL
jgi:hypothetical protein